MKGPLGGVGGEMLKKVIGCHTDMLITILACTCAAKCTEYSNTSASHDPCPGFPSNINLPLTSIF